jgi:hypothetical protein
VTAPPDPPPTIATMRTIGQVWVAVGVLAVLGGAFGTVFAIVIFGVLAIALGVAIVGLQNLRAKSAIRASRTLTNAPAPPADPPPTTPGPPRGVAGGPTPGAPTGSDPDEGSRTVDGGEAPEADVGSPAGSGDGSGDGSGGAEGDGQAVESEPTSVSEEDDGTGPMADDDQRPGERRA